MIKGNSGGVRAQQRLLAGALICGAFLALMFLASWMYQIVHDNCRPTVGLSTATAQIRLQDTAQSLASNAISAPSPQSQPGSSSFLLKDLMSSAPSQPAEPRPVAAPSIPLLQPLLASAQQSRSGPGSIGYVSPFFRLFMPDANADDLWKTLLEGHPRPTDSQAAVVEVGAFDCTQSVFAAKMGFRVLSFEPSPKNHKTCEGIVKDLNYNQREKLTLVQVAASNTTGTVQFSALGSTGDHVGFNPGEVGPYKGTQINVPANTVDRLLDEHSVGLVYVMKIDTQGHEVAVLEGLKNALREKRILFLLFEYWPTAIRTTTGRDAGQILQWLHEFGYQTFDLRAITLHPEFAVPKSEQRTRPTRHDQYARWYEDRDKAMRNSFGSWCDMLAIANVDDIGRFF